MMNKTHNRHYAVTFPIGQVLMRPLSVNGLLLILLMPLPQHRETNRLNAKLCNGINVGRPLVMTGVLELIAKGVAHAIDRAFQPTPQFKIGAQLCDVRSHAQWGPKPAF